MTINEFEGMDPPIVCTDIPCPNPIADMQFDANFGENCLGLVCLIVLFRVLCLVALKVKTIPYKIKRM